MITFQRALQLIAMNQLNFIADYLKTHPKDEDDLFYNHLIELQKEIITQHPELVKWENDISNL